MRVGNTFSAESIQELTARGITAERLEDRLRATANNQLPAFLVAVVLLFALFVALFHVRRERNLLKHLVFALHWTSFYLVLAVIERASGREPSDPGIISAILAVIGLIWMTIALRRTYGQPLAWTIPKAIGLFILFSILLAAWIGLVFEWSMRTI
jgi:hypothetical protein